MDTDLYRFGNRFVDLFEDKTDLNGEKNCTHICITWKRLNVQKATKTNGFLMILRVRVFQCSTEKVSKRSKNEIETRLAWLVDFLLIF